MQYIGYIAGSPFQDTLAELANLPQLCLLDVLVSERGGYEDLENCHRNVDYVNITQTPSSLTFPEGKEQSGACLYASSCQMQTVPFPFQSHAFLISVSIKKGAEGICHKNYTG